MLKNSRVLTAIVLLIVVIIALYIGNTFIIWILLGVAYIFATKEAISLFNLKQHLKEVYIINILSWVLALIAPKILTIPLLAVLIIAGIYAYNKRLNINIIKTSLYPTVGFMAMYQIYISHYGAGIIWLICIVALTDTGAYYIGKSIGEHKLTETSPNKTVEGAIGGIVLATIISSFIGSIGLDISYTLSFIVSLLASISSVLGDLFESYLKRENNVKDSGNILPGHGGVLDRLDGYLFAAIVLIVFV